MSDDQTLSMREFVRGMYGVDYRGFITLWDKQTKKTLFFAATQTEKLERALVQLSATRDLYFGLGLQRNARSSSNRGAADSVVAVPGLFADIDFSSSKGGPKKYPQDEAEALRILGEFQMSPTLIVHTGNGLHVHWLFNGLLLTDRQEKRHAAIQLLRDFQRALQAHFKKRGCEIDSVGDLVRNYRIPGTFNHKSIPAKPVRILKYDWSLRVDAGKLEAWLASGREENKEKPRPDKRRHRDKHGADHELIRENCGWYRHATGEGAADCDEPNWYAAASITARCENGEQSFHDYSSRHPKYSKEEATEKLTRAMTNAGPRTCESIENDLGSLACATCPHRGALTSPIQLGRIGATYDPGRTGPVPLGYTQSGAYAFRDQTMKIIVLLSAQQLLSSQCLLGLAPSSFWKRNFPPGKKGPQFDFIGAGEALIAACRRAGPFKPQNVRGRGIWLDEGRTVVNLGGEITAGSKYQYLCFEPIRLEVDGEVDAARLLTLLRKFNWRNPDDAVLLLGWMAVAVICGVLTWRPHCFIYGPARSGKTTLHVLTAQLLHPLVISTDGQSSEAGIRQTLGADSLPIAIDEFESDQDSYRLRQIIRLARSASSADNPLLRGTPEGKALQFSLRTMFLFSAVNPLGLSVADESRILMLELLMHENDRSVANTISEEEAFFRTQGVRWCAQMVSRAPQVVETLDTFLRLLPTSDRRHRQNMATLLAGAYVALHGNIPDKREAEEWLRPFLPTVDLHAETLDRDDAQECLDYLLAHVVSNFPLGHWAAVAREGSAFENAQHVEEAARVTRIYDMLIHRGNEFEGLLLRNGSPAIDKVFERTRWERRGWMKALKKLSGAFTPKNPVHFPSAGRKDRCTGLPLSCIPEPMSLTADDEISGGKY